MKKPFILKDVLQKHQIDELKNAIQNNLACYAEPDHNYFSIQKNIAFYEQNGFVMLTSDTVNPLLNYEEFFDDKTEIVYEKDKKTIRSIYRFQHNLLFKRWLSSQNSIHRYVTSILGKDVYLHQIKINLKNNNTDSVWPFHWDFPFWHVFDHIPENKMLNVGAYLEDALKGSGEIQLIPQSHTIFLNREQENRNAVYSLEGSASSELLFSFTDDEITHFIEKYGLNSTYGTKGSVLLFNPDIIHGSQMSIDNHTRKLMILTFNSCCNLPSEKSTRPKYLCSNEYEAIKWDTK
jgi:ectoine hydroxylase